MPRTTHENTKVHWLPTVANPAAPTAAEISGGTDLTAQVPVDGVALNNTQNNASQAMLGDAFVAEAVGTWGRGITLTFTRDDTSDAAYDLFTYRTTGNLLISRFGDPAVGSEVEVYPVEAHEAAPLATAENEFQKFEVQLAVQNTDGLRATVAV